jgi:hypothetical protein
LKTLLEKPFRPFARATRQPTPRVLGSRSCLVAQRLPMYHDGLIRSRVVRNGLRGDYPLGRRRVGPNGTRLLARREGSTYCEQSRAVDRTDLCYLGPSCACGTRRVASVPSASVQPPSRIRGWTPSALERQTRSHRRPCSHSRTPGSKSRRAIRARRPRRARRLDWRLHRLAARRF